MIATVIEIGGRLSATVDEIATIVAISYVTGVFIKSRRRS